MASFVSDDQRKAVFAKLKGKGGGSQPKPPKTKLPKLPKADPTPGIPAGGDYIGTGGAIYNNPAGSSWFINPPSAPAAPNYGSLPATGVPQYQQPTFAQFVPSQTLWGDLYLIAMGVVPETGDISAPYGTPGTLKFGAGTLWRSASQEWADAHPIGKARNQDFFGGTSKLSSAYWGQAPNALKKRPWWAK